MALHAVTEKLELMLIAPECTEHIIYINASPAYTAIAYMTNMWSSR